VCRNFEEETNNEREIWGPVPVDQLFQALWQDRDFFRRHRITHLKGVFLYFTACDADGNTVTIRDEHGAPVGGYNTAGSYNSAAAAYDRDWNSGRLRPHRP